VAGASRLSGRERRDPAAKTEPALVARLRLHVLADGRRFRVLVVVDDSTRECLALVGDTFLSGQQVVSELDRIVELSGRPLMIVSDSGTELTSHAILRWQEERGVEWHSIAPLASRSRKCLSREPERALSGRLLERAGLPTHADGPPHRRGLADRLQSIPAACEPRPPHPERVRNPVQAGPQPEWILVVNGAIRGQGH